MAILPAAPGETIVGRAGRKAREDETVMPGQHDTKTFRP